MWEVARKVRKRLSSLRHKKLNCLWEQSGKNNHLLFLNVSPRTADDILHISPSLSQDESLSERDTNVPELSVVLGVGSS